MAEISSKRQREETIFENCEEDPKRQKSYNHILAILEDEEDEPNQDLSSILTTLQQEISLPESTGFDSLPGPAPECPSVDSTIPDYSSPTAKEVEVEEEEDEEERERVMRHLLEASDDELGLPHTVGIGGGDDEINGGDQHGFAFSDSLWEIEDEAANYYTLLQSELFM